VPRTILSNKSWQFCQLWNPTDNAITLSAGTFIGTLTPLDEIVSIAQENAIAAEKPSYLTGEGQGDYPRPNGYKNKHRRYSADRVRASPTNFLSDRNSSRTQNSFSRNKNFAQIDRGKLLKIIIINIAIHFLLNL